MKMINAFTRYFQDLIKKVYHFALRAASRKDSLLLNTIS